MSQATDPFFRRGAVSWMAHNPVAANLLMVSMMVGGLLVGSRMRKEVFPEVQLDRIFITVPYPGASPAEVEQGILLSIEESVRSVEGVKEVRSTASESVGTVSLGLQTGADRNKTLADVQSAVGRITTLPGDAERPIVQLPEIRADAISVVLYGPLADRGLHNLAERVRDELLALPQVSYVEVSGLRPMEVSIEISQDTLFKHGLTLPHVAQQIRRTAIELPAGAVRTRGGEVLLRTAERRNAASEYATIAVAPGSDGAAVLLGDIATIVDGFADVDRRITFDGQPAVLIEVASVGDQSPPEVAGAVKDYVAELKHSLPPGISAATYLDRAELYDQRVDLLLRNAMLGLALVLCILGLFLAPRLAFWVTIGIPISFLGSLLILPALGVTLNMISLFAFLVTLGMVVDDAIVVGENAFRLRQAGYPPMQAAVLGAKEVATPVVFSIATTVTAFSPLLFIPGVRGRFMLAIPLVVIVVLCISLLESFFILPAHLGHSKRPRGETRGILGLARLQRAVSRGLERFVASVYLPVARLAVRHRFQTLAVAIAVFLGSVGLVAGGRVKLIDFPQEESDWVIVQARLPFGAPVEDTEAVMKRLVDGAQQVVDGQPGPASISRGVFAMLGVSFLAGRDGSNVTSVLVTLVPTADRDLTSREFADAWRRAVGEVPGVESLQFDATTGHSSKPIDVEITHREVDALEQAALALSNKLSSFAGVKDIDNGIELGKPQWDFKLSPAGIHAGLTAAELASQVRGAFFGVEAVRQQRGRYEVRTLVRLPRSDRRSLQTVEELLVRTPGGAFMPLRQAANVSHGRAYTAIQRVGGKRTLRVRADVEEGKANAEEITGAVMADILPELRSQFPGLTLARSGRQKDMKSFMDYLKVGFMLALLGMYLLLAVPLRSYAQPLFVVMMAIPFGFTGAILGHLLMGIALSMVSMMGLVALAGVVVNDSLVLVTAANRFRAEGCSPEEAASKAGVQRFRPVLLTSLTTFGGLAPMILETSVQARVLIPMAVSLGFGVLFATLVVLLLVPSLYVITADGIATLRGMLATGGHAHVAAQPRANLEGHVP